MKPIQNPNPIGRFLWSTRTRKVGSWLGAACLASACGTARIDSRLDHIYNPERLQDARTCLSGMEQPALSDALDGHYQTAQRLLQPLYHSALSPEEVKEQLRAQLLATSPLFDSEAFPTAAVLQACDSTQPQYPIATSLVDHFTDQLVTGVYNNQAPSLTESYRQAIESPDSLALPLYLKGLATAPAQQVQQDSLGYNAIKWLAGLVTAAFGVGSVAKFTQAKTMDYKRFALEANFLNNTGDRSN